MSKDIKIQEKNLHPNRGWVLIKTVKVSKETSTGLIIPDSQEPESMIGRVIEVGREMIRDGGVVEQPPFFDFDSKDQIKRHNLVKGDIIIYREHTQHEIPQYDGAEEKLAFVHFDTILGILKDFYKL